MDPPARTTLLHVATVVAVSQGTGGLRNGAFFLREGRGGEQETYPGSVVVELVELHLIGDRPRELQESVTVGKFTCRFLHPSRGARPQLAQPIFFL